MVLSSVEIEKSLTENELGEQSFSGHAQNILTDLSQLYHKKLVAAENEKGTDPFSFWEAADNEILCPKPVLKPVTVLPASGPLNSLQARERKNLTYLACCFHRDAIF
jgi:hypothetical protein